MQHVPASVTLDPYVRIGDTPFTITREEIQHRRGPPWRSGRNGVGLNELDYGDVVYRFQDGGRLEEITFQARALVLGNVAIPFEALAGFLRDHDPQVFERAGFLVSPAVGLAFDPAEPYWITALARHCLCEWEALRSV